MVDSSSYNVSYKNNTNAGTATVTVTAKDGDVPISGSKNATFKINQASQSLKISASGSVTAGGSTYISVSGNKGKVHYSSSNKTLAKVYSSGKVVTYKTGAVKITITADATSNYKPYSKTVTINVKPKSTSLKTISTPKAGQIKVTWNKNTTTDYYQIQYSTSSKFTSSTTKATYSYKNTYTSKTISNLTKGKRYYVRIRAIDSTKKIYSSWSSVKSITVKK